MAGAIFQIRSLGQEELLRGVCVVKNEWAIRLTPTLAALGTAWLTWRLGRRLFGPGVGAQAVLILTSGLGFFVLARMLTPDMFLTFWITAAIACLVRASQMPGDLARWGFFAAMGFGFLTKGPMALVVPVSAALAATLLFRALSFWLPMAPGWWVARGELRRAKR